MGTRDKELDYCVKPSSIGKTFLGILDPEIPSFAEIITCCASSEKFEHWGGGIALLCIDQLEWGLEWEGKIVSWTVGLPGRSMNGWWAICGQIVKNIFKPKLYRVIQSVVYNI